LLLLSVAGIALFVGGVGVMNIMLVNVNERRREIGLRMALGAKQTDIHWQFLAEAVAIALVGGVLGLVVAVVLTAALDWKLSWGIGINFDVVLIAIGTSCVVGITSGLVPARRAASLEPIEALRHE
jgi:putative ABC transport system permease protein